MKAKAQNALFILMCKDNENTLNKIIKKLSFYQIIENKLKNECNFQGPVVPLKNIKHSIIEDEANIQQSSAPHSGTNYRGPRRYSPTFHPNNSSVDSMKFKVNESILYLNRYCAKLPSDTL